MRAQASASVMLVHSFVPATSQFSTGDRFKSDYCSMHTYIQLLHCLPLRTCFLESIFIITQQKGRALPFSFFPGHDFRVEHAFDVKAFVGSVLALKSLGPIIRYSICNKCAVGAEVNVDDAVV